MIGGALTSALLERGHEVIILSRHAQPSKRDKLSYATWNIHDQMIDKNALARADYIVHLAGASLFEKRWTPKRKNEIIDSRVKGAELIAKALAEQPNKVRAVISASGIGYYGDERRYADHKPFDEKDEPADDFIAETAKAWERSAEAMSKLNKRVVIFRIGVVLSNDGGAMKEFLKPLRFGIASILSNGRQMMSWIHIDDLVRLFMFAMENEKIHGVYNAVAPKPVPNKELVLAIANAFRGKFYVPMHVPSIVLKLMLGEMSSEVLKSANVSSRKIEEEGFIFQYPVVKLAMRSLKHSATKAKLADEVHEKRS